MQRFTSQERLFTFAVAAVAGYVDISGYMQLDGYFVSFMSGNTTLLARDLATGAPRLLAPAFLILGFVIGVMTGTLLGDRAPALRQRRVTMLVLCGLTFAALTGSAGFSEMSLGLLVLSMGALNTVLGANKVNPVGLTYMTGALVRTGQMLAERLRGDKTGSPFPFLMLWASLLGGAIFGALIAGRIPAVSLWLAVIAAAALVVMARRAGSQSVNR